MRPPFGQRRSTRPLVFTANSALLTLAALAPSVCRAIHFNQAPSADLDFSNLGRIAIAGDFNGISLYEYEGQIAKPLPTNGSEFLLARLPNGALAPIVSTDASVRAMCVLKNDDGSTKEVVVGGNFTSLDGTQSTAVALFNPNTTDITPLQGLMGEVNALYCDDDSQKTVYVGGTFKGSNSTNAIAWTKTAGWSNLPFAGFNGPVNAISKTSNGHIIFGGSFTGLGNASTPSQPDSQIVNLSGAKITATNGASTNGFSDPKNIVCSAGKDGADTTWLAANGVPATWEADFGFGFQPTKLRLYNTHHDGRGTKTFRFLAFPLNGIMNFTYVDPSTGRNATCTSQCPLSNDGSIKYQDFHFVNRVGMNSFQLAISDWYGAGAGLSGIELFQDDIFAYAISNFNEPSCKGIDFPSTATATGPWKHSPSVQSNSDYLSATFRGGDVTSNSASVVFTPNIVESGNYTVNMYTPGCMPDHSCSMRGRVGVTGTMSNGTRNADFSTTLFQTNYYDKYDQIYFGYVEKSSDTFKPSVTLTPMAGQDVDTLMVVAQRVGFTLTRSAGGLNGLFDFEPSKTTFDVAALKESAINKLGTEFSRDSAVNSLVVSGDTLFVGGNFTSDQFANALAITGDKQTAIPLDGSLNGQVLDMHLEGSRLYAGGSFNGTLDNKKELQHVAVYDLDSKSWSPLGGGVDGVVDNVVSMSINLTLETVEMAIAVSGSFSECLAFGGEKAVEADGFAIWVPSRQNWLRNLDQPSPAFNGVLTASLQNVTDVGDLFAGALTSAQLRAVDVATLSSGGLGAFPFEMNPQRRSASKLSARENTSNVSNSGLQGVVTGAFYTNDQANMTVLAGHFSARSADGTTINNLMLIDGNNNGSISGPGPELSADSTFMTVALRGSVLYAGGMVTGTVNGAQVQGLVSYDLATRSFGSQPAPISGKNGTVAAITVRPDTNDVYVGGSFDKAGALGCQGICIYNADSQQWTQPGSGLSGEVLGLMWSSKTTLIAGGDMVANNTERRYLVTYDVAKETWSAFPGADSIPGPVQVMTPASGDGSQVWVAGKSAKDGSVYLMKYDGGKWMTANETLPANTVLRSLQVFSLTKNHDKTDLVGEDQVLMMTGSIIIPDVGVASAAIFNGTHYRPYALTTTWGNAPGTIARIFTQKDDFFSSGKSHMPLVFVVLIGLAISLGLILLLVLAGMLLDRLRKKREGYTPAPTSMYDKGSGIRRIPPQELLESLSRSRPGAPPHV